MEDIFRGRGVEITLDHPDDFLKVKETLTRIGVASYKNNTLYQSCHILHKRGRYAIVHFKELFILDGKANNLSEEDLLRRNAVADLIEQWGLATIVDPSQVDEKLPINQIKILPFREKENWTLETKYTIGRK